MAALIALGIDVGSTNTKVALVRVADATTLRVAAAPTPQPVRLDAVLAELVERVLVDAGTPPVAVGVASMAETGVPLDRDHRPVAGWLRWDARRGTGQATALADRLGREALLAATGVRPSGKVPLATWAWLAAQGTPVPADGAWAGAADLVVLLLTGRLVTDHTLAGRTMAYRLGSPGAVPAGFDADLLAAAGLRPEQLPRVVPPGQVAGVVTPGSRLAATLPAGVPVIVAGHDHPVGAWAAGVRAPGAVADSLGTAESVYRVVAGDLDPVAAGEAGMSVVRTVAGDRAALVAGSPAAGAVIDDWPDDLVVGVDRAALRAALRRLGDEAARAGVASGAEAGAGGGGVNGSGDGVRLDGGGGVAGPRGGGVTGAGVGWRALDAGTAVVLPYPAGRQCPHPDPRARLQVVGEVRSADELAAAVLRGLALHARWMREAQTELAGRAAASGSPEDVTAPELPTAPEDVTSRGQSSGRDRGDCRPDDCPERGVTSPGHPTASEDVAVLGGAGLPGWLVAKARWGGGPLRAVTATEPVAAGAALLAAARVGVADVAALDTTAVEVSPAPEADARSAAFRAAALSR